MSEAKAEDTLWITRSHDGVQPDAVILGLPLLRRAVLAAERAGFGRILVEETAAGGVPSLVEETRARVLGPMDSVPDLGSGRLVVLSGSVIPQVRWLRDLRQRTVEPRRLVLDPGCAAILETGDLRDAVSILHRRGERTPFDTLSALFPAAAPLAPSGERFEITGAQDLGRAEDWLLQSLIKDTEGFMSRHVERRISLALSRRLASTRVTPNAMTLVSVAVGLLGAALFLRPTAGAPLAGALLVLAHSILDGCDGELARLKFQESRFGGVLDFWGDNVVHCAVFGAIALSWSRAAGAGWPLLLGAAAILGSLFSAAFVYRHTMAQVQEGPLFTSVSREPGSPFSRMADALARRDFLYLLVLLAALGKSHWFLALAAAGSPIYFLLLLAIVWAGRRRQGNAPETAAKVAVRVNNPG
jgi:1L-myo-inositol 1-phosphate cytidylyltransferase / CDP-L-myo-inositol myo-inositolphosphotransferase